MAAETFQCPPTWRTPGRTGEERDAELCAPWVPGDTRSFHHFSSFFRAFPCSPMSPSLDAAAEQPSRPPGSPQPRSHLANVPLRSPGAGKRPA